MTYTTLLISALTAVLPLTAVAKDVKGISRAKLCAEGYKVGCPEDEQNKVVKAEEPAKEESKMTEEDKRKLAEETVGEDKL
jgi:hypothetical protein